jgi:hypothetical protein
MEISIEIFSRYISKELQWENNNLNKAKNYDDVSFIPTELPT